MIPALLMVGVGWQRRIPLPIPLFLAWPLVLLAAAIAIPVQAIRRRELVHPLLAALFQLSGLRVDVRARDGANFLIWFL